MVVEPFTEQKAIRLFYGLPLEASWRYFTVCYCSRRVTGPAHIRVDGDYTGCEFQEMQFMRDSIDIVCPLTDTLANHKIL